MSRTETGMVLRQALASAERIGVGRGYPREVRRRAIAYVERRHREGAIDEEFGRELGIRAMTFRRWVGIRATAFEAVAVVEESRSASFVVQGPRGMRIEALAVDQLVELWARLS